MDPPTPVGVARRAAMVLALACAGVALGGLAQAAFAASPPGAVVSCPPRLECGVVPVPLDHATPAAGEVRLVVSRLRARRGPSGGTLLFLTGGPGQASIARDTPDFMLFLRRLSQNRQVVAVDLRGTGRSGALGCPSLNQAEMAGADDPNAVERAVAVCAREIGPTRRYFTTAQVVEDLEVVRRGLGVERWAVGGVSYGTYVATRYARAHPDRVERLVLDSLVPVDGVRPTGVDGRAATRVLANLCSAGSCRGITRDLVRDVARLEAILAARSLPGTVVDRRGVASRVSLGGPSRPGLVYNALLRGDLDETARRSFPGAVRSALGGDSTAMLRILAAGGGDDLAQPTRLSTAALLASICQDTRLPWETGTPVEVRRTLRDTPAEPGGTDPSPFPPSAAAMSSPSGLCVGWPEAAEAAVGDGPLPDVPVLVLSGGADLRTPLEDAKRLRKITPRTEIMVAPHRGHSVITSNPDCAAVALRRFFAGDPVGNPCAGLRRSEALPMPPASLFALRSGPARARSARALVTALEATLGDASTAVAFGRLTTSGIRATGLRGGTLSLRFSTSGLSTGLALVLDRYEYVRGVRVSGVLREDLAGNTQGRLRIASPGGRAAVAVGRGRIRLRLNGGPEVARPTSFSPSSLL
jgi:pimeloyl-ACP methyl ester carboxylesterase